MELIRVKELDKVKRVASGAEPVRSKAFRFGAVVIQVWIKGDLLFNGMRNGMPKWI